MRIIVEEAVTKKILTRDLIVQEPKVVRTLSGPSTIQFQVMEDEYTAQGINFKAYGQIIHVETERQTDGNKWIIASGITLNSEVDAESGTMTVNAEGVTSYLGKMPWLDNWNPIAVDPFAVIHRIWDHVQGKIPGQQLYGRPDCDLGVTVEPAESNTLLLPGFYFDGSSFVLDFFAYFVRANDYRECLEEITSLCRDIPIDFREDSFWNEDRTAISKVFQLGYQNLMVHQGHLTFRIGENVLKASPSTEQEIDWTSDVIVRGWWPGKMHSSQLSNADTNRFRKVVKDEDILINSRERAEVWARRKLARRQVPLHWTSLNLDLYHPNAPWGSYDVGDEIFIQGYMPFKGKVEGWHRILSIEVNDEIGEAVLTTRHVDSFNYDPIIFPPGGAGPHDSTAE